MNKKYYYHFIKKFSVETISALAIASMLLVNTGIGNVITAGAQAAAMPETPWHTVYRRLNMYNIYKVESGGSIIGVYATDVNGDRVKDPSLEELLVFDAATLDKDPGTFEVPSYIFALPYPNT